MNGAPLGLLPDLDNNVAEKVRLQQRLSFAAGSETEEAHQLLTFYINPLSARLGGTHTKRWAGEPWRDDVRQALRFRLRLEQTEYFSKKENISSGFLKEGCTKEEANEAEPLVDSNRMLGL